MGLYDEINCNYPLPESENIKWPSGQHFQTKSLDSMLNIFTITPEGILQDQKGERVYFTGEIEFYDSPLGTYTNGDWAEYLAEFIKGLLISINRRFLT